MVETGFPTSLIDLFVKNRSRFQRRSSKKHLPLEISDPQPLLPAPPPSPSSLATSLRVSPARFGDKAIHEDIDGGPYCGSSSIPVGECQSRSDPTPSTKRSNSRNIVEVSVETRDSGAHSSWLVRKDVHKHVDGGGHSGRVLDRVCITEPNVILAAILNLFAVVVLMLWVKKLSVGIILSAFVLLFFEYVGKHTASCLNLKLFWSTNKEFKYLASRFSCSFWFQAKKMQSYEGSEQESMVHEEEKVVVQATESEIEIHNELKSINGDQKLVCPEIEDNDSNKKVVDECKISEGKRKGKHRAELKSKMMKILVPRKLRAPKKEKKEKRNKNKTAESTSEALTTIEGVKSASFEIEDQEKMIQRSKLECIEEDEEKPDYGTTCSIVESARTDNDGNSECIVLILIALSGLVGGRTIAVLVTMAGCFMIKMVKKIRGRLLNLSVIKVSLYQSSGKRR